jgi:hypothetical protein
MEEIIDYKYEDINIKIEYDLSSLGPSSSTLSSRKDTKI